MQMKSRVRAERFMQTFNLNSYEPSVVSVVQRSRHVELYQCCFLFTDVQAAEDNSLLCARNAILPPLVRVARENKSVSMK